MLHSVINAKPSRHTPLAISQYVAGLVWILKNGSEDPEGLISPLFCPIILSLKIVVFGIETVAPLYKSML